MRVLLAGLLFCFSLLQSFELKAETSSAAQAEAQKQIVFALGEASGGTGSTLEEIKNQALAEARRNALEQSGTLVFSQTETENYVLQRDQVKTMAQGLVKVLEVLETQTKFDEEQKSFLIRVKIKAEVQTVAAQALLQSLNHSLQSGSSPLAPLKFSFNLVAWEPVQAGVRGIQIKTDSSKQYQQKILKEGESLSSGAEFQIHFRPEQDCYLYGASVDSQGQVFALIPHPDGLLNNALKAGKSYVLPAPGKFYQLDQNRGEEKLYLIAAHAPQPDIQILLQQSYFSQPAEVLEAMVKVRGISQISTGQAQNYQVTPAVSVQALEEWVQGNQNAVRVFRFLHN
ncbi:hypothetical protein COW36_01055 [bacterium (Candidatus Blackallbacteria) CG17_big_fil_post_rev_8_21_14_2_50_48_46]|uniref:DUF4384 domain-containing protein n=1 Tax=bacterium (Candidatus Blackallbacteria) CG17_big_fil_post_rev_8_21_14_2_50_48_46 TaxID=2014261 RepID=A0A2M7GB90_9BACT|nr:MAG: hypothetical protein COW64_10120 [bacterium (Candidatus Blackallbacteria) CG18_big_fil_WC_8_21_14_2_50_49_26]PIW19456.1 MAG: hypothetical protein COW36_01055 [bacterium (Candidatus Blackallbacteria) CG17_big_fil_post_rev_8_21_14_2_50_48_46]PIW48940.1 MAG: hypothetical protein COW20_07400 [bacterium (Candidatus Blackallbacteria) CG13_big_fil_rev_8_21_14_2_50_49_14]